MEKTIIRIHYFFLFIFSLFSYATSEVFGGEDFCKIDVCNCCGESSRYIILDSTETPVASFWTDSEGCAYGIGGTAWSSGATYHIVMDLQYCNESKITPITVYFTACVCTNAGPPYEKIMLPCCPNGGAGRPSNLGELPLEFKLNQNYPNPFNPTTNISFELPKAEIVTLTIYDIAGKVIVQPIVRSELKAGYHEYMWNTSSKDLASGVYIYKLQAGSYVAERKMVLLK